MSNQQAEKTNQQVLKAALDLNSFMFFRWIIASIPDIHTG